MDEFKVNNGGFIRDMGWYLLGTIVPMAVGFIRTPIFTRYFTPEEFGYLGIVSITFSYVSVFLYSWLSGCLWRYYNAFKEKKDLSKLYSNIFLIFSGASLLLAIVSGTWYMLTENPLVKQLILLSFVQYLIRELIGLYLIVARLEGKALKYNIIHSLRVLLSFVLLYVMAFHYHFRITSVLTSTIVVDLIVILYLLLLNRERVIISIKNLSRHTLNILFRFGSVGLVTNFCFLLVSSSDRYIIAMFSDMATVGIYNQVYNISQLSVAALVTVFFNTINPKLNKELEINFKNSDILISKYLYVFLLFGLPVVTYLSLFSKEISFILLGEEFRSGFTIMPFVFISAFLYGLFMFIEVKFKFADKLKNIAIGVILASALNIGLNFIFIPVFGFQSAAVTTLAAYLFLLLYFYTQDSAGFVLNRIYVKDTILFLMILSIQVAFDLFLRKLYVISIYQTILEAILLFAIYLLILRKRILKIKISI
jgi:O-antigen/teichoic acid export membrane protein